MHWLRTTFGSYGRRRFAAVYRCLARGENPWEVMPLGSCTRMSGDLLTDGDEAPRWHLEMAA